MGLPGSCRGPLEARPLQPFGLVSQLLAVVAVVVVVVVVVAVSY